jgi:hypothetical protein
MVTYPLLAIIEGSIDLKQRLIKRVDGSLLTTLLMLLISHCGTAMNWANPN